MTDIHSHILFGVDDGSRSIEESIKLLKKLKSVGFNHVILTSHYIEGSEYNADNSKKREIFLKLKQRIVDENIDIDITLGNEIFINDHIIPLINDGYISPIGDSKYLLVELPFHNKLLNLEDIIYEIKISGYTPIIAHPERYTYLQEDYSLVDALRKDGNLFQANYASILGHYGKGAEKLMKYMLKNRYIDYLGTDIHRAEKDYVVTNFEKIIKHIKKVTKEDYFLKIMENCDNLVK